jgi:hypothetical protein
MIQTKLLGKLETWINTEANRISPATKQNPIVRGTPTINFLFKFTNDISGDIQYSYPKGFVIYDRATFFDFQDTLSLRPFLGQLALKLAGYWKYEIYEVYWEQYPSDLEPEFTPLKPDQDMPIGPEFGKVQGLVAIGKMYVGEISGSEEVQYREYVAPDKDNYIYHGQ